MNGFRRDSSVDVINGLAIIAMVVGHTCMYQAPDNFVNLFHMSCFLMASGFFFKEDRFGSILGLWQWIRGKLLRLYMPFVLWTATFIILQNVLIKVNVYSDNPHLLDIIQNELVYLVHPLSCREMIRRVANAVVLQGSTVLSGPLWFLRTLFWVCVTYGVASWFILRLRLKPLIVQSCIAVCFLWGGKYVSFQMCDWIGGACFFVCYALFHWGRILRVGLNFDFIARAYHLPIVGCVALMVLVGVYWRSYYILLAQNAYKSGFIVVVAATSGWLVLLTCYRVFNMLRLQWIVDMLIYVGQHTMSILIFHLLAFRIVNYPIVWCKELPWCCVAAESNLLTGWPEKLIYVVVGIGVPLIADNLYGRIYNGLFRVRSVK